MKPFGKDKSAVLVLERVMDLVAAATGAWIRERSGGATGLPSAQFPYNTQQPHRPSWSSTAATTTPSSAKALI